MNILLTGSSTILGSACIKHFFENNHTLFILDTLPESKTEIESQLNSKTDGQEIDVVILAEDERLLKNTTTRESFRAKRSSMYIKISHLMDHLSQRRQKPHTVMLVSSIIINSSVGLGGRIGQETNVANASAADYYQLLEQITNQLKDKKIRVVSLRFGKVVSKLLEPVEIKLPFSQKLLPTLRHDHNHKISWISQEDAVRAMVFLMEQPDIVGPVNLTSGTYLSADEYYSLIERKFGLRRLPPLPYSVLKIFLGNELCSCLSTVYQAQPTKLERAGFLFKDTSLAKYLDVAVDDA